MSEASLFGVRILRASTVGPRRLVVGAQVKVDAATAAQMLRDGQARLLDEADLTVLAELVSPRQVRPRLLAP